MKVKYLDFIDIDWCIHNRMGFYMNYKGEKVRRINWLREI